MNEKIIKLLLVQMECEFNKNFVPPKNWSEMNGEESLLYEVESFP